MDVLLKTFVSKLPLILMYFGIYYWNEKTAKYNRFRGLVIIDEVRRQVFMRLTLNSEIIGFLFYILHN